MMRTLSLLIVAAVISLPALAGEKPPSWNGNAKQFIFAPSFDIPPVKGATVYRFTLRGDDAKPLAFDSPEPTASLTPLWEDVPVGPTTLTIEALNKSGGDVIAVAGTRHFHRAAAFDGPYGRAIVPYDRSAALALQSVVNEPFVQSWRTTGQPDPSYTLYRYPAKVIGSLISGCAMYAQLQPRPRDADEAIKIARRAADYLIGISCPPDAPLAFMPPTYHTDKPTDRENDRWTMMMTPAEAAQGYLDLWQATSDRKYLDTARRIADSYVRLQLPSGTWHLKVDNRTGEAVAPNLLIPSEVIRLLDRLATEYRLDEYAEARDRAVEWIMKNPARTFDWSAQFDDAKVRNPYENLSKHEACEFAIYLFEHRREIDLAEEILRFAEDQFVIWVQPPKIPPRNGMEQLDPSHWITPCSAEQYAMFEPVSGSSAFMITACVAAYRATGKSIYLTKAQSLANALTVAQQKTHGRYPTRMIEQDMQYWLNSTVNTARAVQLLADAARRS